MATTLQANDTQVIARHRDSMMASLARRMEVAQSRNDFRLVELLEQEKAQIAADANTNGILRSLAAGLKTLQQRLVRAVFGGAELQVHEFGIGSDHWWYAFDPQTGQTVYADSEAELRLWIEANYQGK